jgi:hypothetical protein
VTKSAPLRTWPLRYPGLLLLIAVPALAIGFAITPHRDCVEHRAELLKQFAYREVPERAEYAAEVYCRRRGAMPAP